MAEVRARSLGKSYGSVAAVSDVSLNVRAGEIVALLGPNGAGKSTTVRMLVGILEPDRGSVTFESDGVVRPRIEPRRLGYLPEDRGLLPDAPVHRTLTYFGTLRGLSRRDAARAATEGLERVGLGDRAADRVDSLSKGNQQKIQLLAATLHEPDVAVLDEPFSGLDPIHQERVMDDIRALKRDGRAVLLSAHQMDLVESLADRILVMNRGRIALSGTLEEIRSTASSGTTIELSTRVADPASALASVAGVHEVDVRVGGEVRLRLQPDAEPAGVLAAVAAAVPLVDIRTRRESLREMFVRAVSEEES